MNYIIKKIKKIKEDLYLDDKKYHIDDFEDETINASGIKSYTNKKTGTKYFLKKFDKYVSGNKNHFSRVVIEYVGYRLYKLFSSYTPNLKVSKRMIISLEKDESIYNYDSPGFEFMLTTRSDFGEYGVSVDELLFGNKEYDDYDKKTFDREAKYMNNLSFMILPFLAYTGHYDLHSGNIIVSKRIPKFYLIDFEMSISNRVKDVIDSYFNQSIKEYSTYSLKGFLRNYEILYKLTKANKIIIEIEKAILDFIKVLNKEKRKKFINNEIYEIFHKLLIDEIKSLKNTLNSNLSIAFADLNELKQMVEKELENRNGKK